MSPHIPNFDLHNTSRGSNNDFHFSLGPDCTVYRKNKGKSIKGRSKDKTKKKFVISRADFVIEFKSNPGDDPFVDKPFSSGKPSMSSSSSKLSISSGKLSVSSGKPSFGGGSGSGNSSNTSHLRRSRRLETPVKSPSPRETPVGSPSPRETPVSSFPPHESSVMPPPLRERNPFLSTSHSALMVLGQLTAYATAVMGAQYRTHMFMVLIVKDYARLIRWDRSGVVVTEPIRFNEQRHLYDFFIRYNTAEPNVRGHDSTVGEPTDAEVKHAKTIVPELIKETSFVTLTVSGRRFITHSPSSQLYVPVGRWTRASFAFDIDDECRVLLKDSWRVLLEDIHAEGDIYSELHKHGVPNIPRCLFYGDIGHDDYHRSRTQDVKEQYFPDQHYWRLTPHRHYRIVLGTIGTPLKNFRNTKEMAKAISAALKGKTTIFSAEPVLIHIIAHEVAHNYAGILHRDISPGNILIFGADESRDCKDPHNSTIDGGMLIDWDLSKPLCSGGQSTARQHARTVRQLREAVYLTPDISFY